MAKKTKKVFLTFYESPNDLVTKTIEVVATGIANAIVDFSKSNKQEIVMARTEDYYKKS